MGSYAYRWSSGLFVALLMLSSCGGGGPSTGIVSTASMASVQVNFVLPGAVALLDEDHGLSIHGGKALASNNLLRLLIPEAMAAVTPSGIGSIKIVIVNNADGITKRTDTFNATPGQQVSRSYDIQIGNIYALGVRAFSGPLGSGTKVYEATGTINLTTTVAGKAVAVSVQMLPVINVPPAPTAPAITTTSGSAASSQIAPNDPNSGDTFTAAITTLPTNGSATVNASGLVGYSPNSGFVGTDSITVTVTDQGGLTGTVTIPVTVTAPANSPPVFTGTPTIVQTSAVVADTLTLTGLGTSDVNGNTVTLSYQWKSNGVAITGATSVTLVVQAVARGKNITCVITANDGTGAANATATATTAGLTITNNNVDHDGDGMMTDTEVLFGSNPTLASSLPAAQVIGQTNSLGVALSNALNNAGRDGDPSPYGLYDPAGLSIDAVNHRLFVADRSNNRILVFQLNTLNDISSRKAINVIGQADFEHSQANRGKTVSANTLYTPESVDYYNDDTKKWLIVADMTNHRVLIYNITNGISNGMAASTVLDQTSMTSSASTALLTAVRVMTFGSKVLLAVGDYSNDRVMLWDISVGGIGGLTNNQTASFVLGQINLNTVVLNNTSSTKMNGPSGFAQSGNTLFVADQLNHRILAFSLGANAANLANGMAASNVLGQSTFTTFAKAASSTALYAPKNLEIYPGGGTTYLFVSDHNNSRVLAYDLATITNGMAASFVYGQTTFTTSSGRLAQNGFGSPWGLAIAGNRMLVADDRDDEILSFNLTTLATQIANASYSPNAINNLGQSTWVSGDTDGAETSVWDANATNNAGPTGIRAPTDVALGTVQGTQYLFVTDDWRERILVFAADVNGTPLDLRADFVLGQVDFEHQGTATTQSGMNLPRGLAFDSSTSRLFVGDTSNNRVLVFDLAAGISNNMNATVVLGQTGFTTSTTTAANTPTATGLNDPQKMVVGTVGATRYLFVVDRLFDRVLLYNISGTISNGMSPSFLLGGPNFTTNLSGADINKLLNPRGVDFDPAKKWLFVADGNADRVLIWDLSGGVTNGMNASFILGQTVSTSVASGLSQRQFNDARDVAFDKTHNVLWVSDNSNNRVMGFDMSGTISNGMNASYVIGQPDFVTRTSYRGDHNRTALTVHSPTGLTMGAGGRLIIVNRTDNRVQIIAP